MATRVKPRNPKQPKPDHRADLSDRDSVAPVCPGRQSKPVMLYTIALVLIILWLLGLVTGSTMGGFVHVLLVIAIVVILLRVISGRKAL